MSELINKFIKAIGSISFYGKKEEKPKDTKAETFTLPKYFCKDLPQHCNANFQRATTITLTTSESGVSVKEERPKEQVQFSSVEVVPTPNNERPVVKLRRSEVRKTIVKEPNPLIETLILAIEKRNLEEIKETKKKCFGFSYPYFDDLDPRDWIKTEVAALDTCDVDIVKEIQGLFKKGNLLLDTLCLMAYDEKSYGRMEMLLKAGVSPKNIPLDCQPPLCLILNHFSSQLSIEQQIKFASLLLQYGADVNAANSSKKTPLMLISSDDKKIEIFKLLLSYNVDINQAGLGDTALHVACATEATLMIKALLAAGASTTMTNNVETAFELAFKYDCTESIKVILDYKNNKLDYNLEKMARLYGGNPETIKLFEERGIGYSVDNSVVRADRARVSARNQAKLNGAKQ